MARALAVTLLIPALLLGASPPAGAATTLDGSWSVDGRGHVYAFGNASHLGEGLHGTVGMAATRTGDGYWLVTGDGTVVARGDAADLGPRPPLRPGELVVEILADPSSPGAWLVTNRGAVHARGGAGSFGDATSLPLNQPVISAVATPAGDGYWLVALDGGVFSFGTARFHGSMGGRHLNGPVIGLVPAPDGDGYWLVATDGGIFSFGTARFHGSMGGRPLARPVVGMVGAGSGYLMVGADGGAFTFGPGVNFHGSLGGSPPAHDAVAIVPVPGGTSPDPLGADPPFHSDVRAVHAGRLWASWRPGCPVPPEDLRVVTVDHWGMGGHLLTGEVVVHRDLAAGIVRTMRDLHAARFPFARMELVDLYWGDDDASMAANNTSAFNCRAVTGGSGWSEHAYGRAIDVNPVQNPYVRGATVLPPAGGAYVDRGNHRSGMIQPGDAVVDAFAANGWSWGGSWSSLKDYQHFSPTGR